MNDSDTVEEAIERAMSSAKKAWGVNRKVLEGRRRSHRVSFWRGVVITSLHYDFGVEKSRACRACGRRPKQFGDFIRTVAYRLETDETYQRQYQLYMLALREEMKLAGLSVS